ncbi:MAG: hypothetical protein JRI23_22180 [Deltaproteobacteria bacterium]|jgi:hypothetical protein|nr:hypothetical protein [Deltaproteobacteria bacterium]MBW2534667.1 hypothetical protein [Deltaproteobacteria bacterium]
MKLTSLIALLGVAAIATGCTVKSQPPAKSATPQEEEPVVVVQTPNGHLLPGGSEWEWTPTEKPMRLSSDGEIPATSLSAEKSSRRGHLKKKAPERDEQ